jgi:hypothetical protein
MGESNGRGTRKIIEINSKEKQDKKGIPPASGGGANFFIATTGRKYSEPSTRN